VLTRVRTAALLVTVVDAVVGAVTAGPLRNTAVICPAGELRVVTLVVWTHWTDEESEARDTRHGTDVRMVSEGETDN